MTPRDHQECTSLEIATATQFYEWHDPRTIPMLLSIDREASWSLPPSSVTSTLWLMVQKTYFGIFNISDKNKDNLAVQPVLSPLSLFLLCNISYSIFCLARLVKANKHLSNTAFSLIPSQHCSQPSLKRYLLPIW